jgi:hypothetical protein
MKQILIVTAIAGTMLWPFLLFAQGIENAKQQDTDGAFLLDTIVTYYQVPAGEDGPDIAFDGENYMGVWTRNGAIVAGRVTKEGVLIDTNGIIVKKSDQCVHPAIAYGNGYYLVTWEDGLGYNPDRIYFARISKTGIVLDTQAILVGKLLDQMRPDVASDGTNYLIVWEDCNQQSICGAIVDTSGNIIKSKFEIAYEWDSGPLQIPAVTYGNGYYMIAWKTSGGDNVPAGVYGARVTPQGDIIKPADRGFLVTNKMGDNVSLAYGNGKYLVAWDIFVNYDEYFNVYCMLVDTSGQVLDTAGTVISNKSKNEIDPGIDFDGTNFVVCWFDARSGHYELYGARVDTAGHNLDTAGVWLGSNLPDYGYPAAIVKGDSNCLLLWSDRRNNVAPYNGNDIFGEIILPDLSFQNSFPIAQYVDTLANKEYAPAVAFDGNDYMASFASHQGKNLVCATNVDNNGDIIHKYNIDSTGISLYDENYPTQISFGDSTYLMSWVHETNIKYIKLTKLGTPIDTITEFGVGNYYETRHLALCWGDTTWLVSWPRNGILPYSIPAGMCRRISGSGVLLGENTEIQSGYAGLPSIAYDGARFLVVYKHDIITGRFVDGNGAVSSEFVYFPSTSLGHHPSIAFDGANYMAVWHDSLAGGSYDIYAARVNPAGDLVDTTAITVCGAAGSQRNPIIAYSGSYYTVLWEDCRGGTQWDIYGARVGTTGQIINQFTVSTMTGDKSELAAAHGYDDTLLLVFTAPVDSVNGKYVNALRVWGKFIDGTTGINAEYPDKSHQRTELHASYPNPFRLSTSIRYMVPQKKHVSLSIYNIAGQRIKILYDGMREAGEYTAHWNGCDDRNNKVATGIYFYALRTDDLTVTKKMVLLK